MPLVETCIANLEPMDRTRLHDAPFDVVVKPCLQRCGTCRERAVLVVDGDARTGESHGSLLKSLTGEFEPGCVEGNGREKESGVEGRRERTR